MADDEGLWIDGQSYTDEDLTFREQHEVRRIVRGWNEDIEDFDVSDATPIDLIPAIYCVIKRRSEPGFTTDQALEIKFADLEKPKAKPRARAKADPT